MGLFGKSKKQKAKEAEELATLNSELETRQKKAADADKQKEEFVKKQQEVQNEVNKVKAAFDAEEDAFNAEKAKYDAEMAKLEAHNKEFAKVDGQKKKTAAAKAALEEAERLLQEAKDALEKETKESTAKEASCTGRLTTAKTALKELHGKSQNHEQGIISACIAGAVAKHEEQFAHEQHGRMVTDLADCQDSIPGAKERLAEAEAKLKPVSEAHEIASKILEEQRSAARAQEEEEAKAKGALGVVQQELAGLKHSKAQNAADLTNVEKFRLQKATDLSVIQREISDLDDRHKNTRQDISETTSAQQNAEERLEAARRRFATDTAALERGMAEKEELELKVDNAEEDLRTAKAARERSESLLEALKSEMTAKITELTWVQKECSELRTMSTKNLKELSLFVDKRNSELRSFRANQQGAKQEAVHSASERQKVQQKESANASAMNLLSSQKIRSDD